MNCYPLNCRESKSENEVCKYLRSICDEEILQSSKKVIKPYELDMYVPSKNFAIEFNGMYWHSIECNTPYEYHKTKTDMCEKIGVDLLHIIDVEWNSRRAQVENHIALALGYDSINSCKPEIVMHMSKHDGQTFFEQNAVAYKQLKNNCLAIRSNGKTVFVAEVELYDNQMIIKQFCFKMGYVIENAFTSIIEYANKANVIVYRDRRLWTRMFFNKSFCHLREIEPQMMFFKKHNYSTVFYESCNSNDISFRMYDSGIEVLKSHNRFNACHDS